MDNGPGKSSSLQDRVEIEVPHVQQLCRWDCGLASTQMVLKHFGISVEDFKKVCKGFGFGNSVWTIDIAHILFHYGVKHVFCTITLGVDVNYSNKSFYRSHFQRDEMRVNDLFTNAAETGISIQKRSVALDEILQHLSSGHLLIVLTDWSKLNCKWCKRKCCLHPNFGCMTGCPSAYQGHFIVVCGYSAKEKLIYYHNPSYKTDLCCCSMRVFEQARKSYGTDEDVVFIYHGNHRSTNVMDGNEATTTPSNGNAATATSEDANS